MRKQRSKTLRFLSLLMISTLCFQVIATMRFTSPITKTTTLRVCMRLICTVPTTWREPSLTKTELYTAKCRTMKKVLMTLWTPSCLNPFSQAERKCVVDPIASCSRVNYVLTVSRFLKVRLGLISGKHGFYMINGNSKVSLGNVGFPQKAHHNAPRMSKYYKKRMVVLDYTPVKLI